MKILYLSQLVPYPPDAGPKIRIYHLLQYLQAAGHEVTLLAFQRPEDKPAQLDHLRTICSSVLTVPMLRSRWRDIYFFVRSAWHQHPFLVARDEVLAMHIMIKDILDNERFSAVHADQLWMAQYALAGCQDRDLLKVLDQHNAVFRIPKRLIASQRNPILKWLLEREADLLFRYETTTCQSFDHVVWVTESDRAALGYGAADSRNWTIPICVDPNTKSNLAPSKATNQVTFLGGLHWPPNALGVRWFLDQVWPKVINQQPKAKLTIIGKDPPPDLIRQASETIEITGYVDDPEPHLARTNVFIVPLHAGGGMRVKIIDAWSWGLPIVSTRIGAEGLAVDDGNNVLLADDPDAFAQAILCLLNDGALADRLAFNGRRTVETKYNWQETYQIWDRIYGDDRSC